MIEIVQMGGVEKHFHAYFYRVEKSHAFNMHSSLLECYFLHLNKQHLQNMLNKKIFFRLSIHVFLFKSLFDVYVLTHNNAYNSKSVQ
jgi:hypothetical protein